MSEKNRLKIDNKLREILGSSNVYYQPPTGKQLKYPAIVYTIYRKDIYSANNKNYLVQDAYDVTLITTNPITDIPDKLIAAFSTIEQNRHFVNDNMYHWTFTIY